MKFVCVTSCITGIAHTYMAAEALEQAGKKLGHEVLVETQGSAGSNPIKQEIIDAADGVIFAVDLEVKDRDRFNGKPYLQIGVAKAINGAPALVEELIKQIKDGKVLVDGNHPLAGLKIQFDLEILRVRRIRVQNDRLGLHPHCSFVPK